MIKGMLLEEDGKTISCEEHPVCGDDLWEDVQLFWILKVSHHLAQFLADCMNLKQSFLNNHTVFGCNPRDSHPFSCSVPLKPPYVYMSPLTFSECGSLVDQNWALISSSSSSSWNWIHYFKSVNETSFMTSVDQKKPPIESVDFPIKNRASMDSRLG